jgi:oligopeptidase B
MHGDTRIDNYYWLRERENPEVIAYLEAENDYALARLAHTKPLQEMLFNEIKGRIKQADESVPYQKDDYYYYQRYETGEEYPIYRRKRAAQEAPEETMVDVNILSKGHAFFSIRGLEISSEQDILAYGIDTQGRKFHTLHFKDLSTGELLEDSIPRTTGNCAWANDNRTIFYTKQHPETLRAYQVYRHVLGTDSTTDSLVYEEEDETFSVNLSKTKSRRYILLASSQTLSTEYRYLEADNPLGPFAVVQSREQNHEYHVDHYQDSFYIRTNLDAQNFRLMETPVSHPARSNWRELISHQADVFLEGFEIFRDYLVLLERKEGLQQVHIRPWSRAEGHYIDLAEPAFEVNLAENWHFDTDLLRFHYSSLTTPDSVYDYDMKLREKVLLKRDEVLEGYLPEDYESLRLYATAEDGVRVPISLVYRKDLRKGDTNPLLLHGYGSYGSNTEADFDAARVSLLDRGFVFAIAHIRGGQELGRHWYEDGKLLKKKNTFTDFISCAEYLIEEGYTDSEKLFATGKSAGGLLVGAVTNMRPDLFKGVIAKVPWMDVVTTMLDSDIPLTTSEFDEWGNPELEEYYRYMLSYSPYDNVEAKDYPNLLVTTALEDSQVQYWEPAKWTAKLRALKTDDNLLLLTTIMQGGHGGPSGRYKKYSETALHYAFLLDLVGIRG